ncbi:MAG: Holliday junction branch migration protein RuvA [Lachnospiraceae bacterium]
MIAYVKGKITEITEDNVVVETHDIGYNIKISTGDANILPPIGSMVKIHTYTYVKEDAFHLYGFLTKDNLMMFRLLITVNGIGPKGALAILSIMDADELRYAIIAADAKAIAKAPGVGAKTAERLILDLRDKVSIEDTFKTQDTTTLLSDSQNNLNHSAKNEAIEALVALGYSASDALRVMQEIIPTQDMDTEGILKEALKRL